MKCSCVSEEIAQGSGGETVVLVFRGRIEMGAEVSFFHDKISNYVKAGYRHIALGFGDEDTFLDSIGLGWIVEFHGVLKQRNGSLVVFSPSRKAAHVMVITTLWKITPVFPSKEAALSGAGRLEKEALQKICENLRKEKRNGTQLRP